MAKKNIFFINKTREKVLKNRCRTIDNLVSTKSFCDENIIYSLICVKRGVVGFRYQFPFL